MEKRTFINIITMECIDDKLYQSKMEELRGGTGIERCWGNNYYLRKILKRQLDMDKNRLGCSHGYFNIEENKLKLTYVIIYDADNNEELCKKIKLVISNKFWSYKINEIEEIKVKSLVTGSVLFSEISNEVFCRIFDHTETYKRYNEHIEHTRII